MNHYNFFTKKPYSKTNAGELAAAAVANNYQPDVDNIYMWMSFAQIRHFIKKTDDYKLIIKKGSTGVKIKYKIGEDLLQEDMIFRTTTVFHLSQINIEWRDQTIVRHNRDCRKDLMMRVFA